jgi:hypothetical protein
MNFEPKGPTANPQIPHAQSLGDYIGLAVVTQLAAHPVPFDIERPARVGRDLGCCRQQHRGDEARQRLAIGHLPSLDRNCRYSVEGLVQATRPVAFCSAPLAAFLDPLDDGAAR